VSPKEEYSRADVRRKFGLSERQLRGWERRGLIPAATSYTFSDLIGFHTLIKLRENKVSSQEIARALESLREKLAWVKQPLSELKVVSDNGRIAVHLSGQKMEAVSGQILLDFDAGAMAGIRNFPAAKPKVDRTHESELWFQKGLELEERGAPVDEAIAAYQKVLELNRGAAGALVNLGTIYYRLRKFEDAEKHYREAIEADPANPLAQFNLGNLNDEQGRLDEALVHYRRALELNPHYADAHFNLALLCERQGDGLKAVHHWKTYLKLDGAGQWADIARRQLERLRQAMVL